MDPRNRSRLQAGLIAAVFVIPVVVAGTMALLGWAPKAQSYGEPILPERSLAGVPVQLADGRPFRWKNPDAVWTLVALPGPDCAARCVKKLDLAHRAQITLGRHAGKLRLLYLGTPPADTSATGFERAWLVASAPASAFAGERATAPDSVSAVLVTPSGKAFLRYVANFNARGLRKDLVKVVH